MYFFREENCLLKAFQHSHVHSYSPCCGFFKYAQVLFFTVFVSVSSLEIICMEVLECVWSHAVLSCILNGQRGIVDWLFMCLKKGRGKVILLVWQHNNYTLCEEYTQLDENLGFFFSLWSLCCCHHSWREGQPYVELLLVVVDACQRDKRLRQIWERKRALWLAKHVSCSRHLLLRLGLQAEGRVGEGVVVDPWTCSGEVTGLSILPCFTLMWSRVVAK